MGFNTQNARVFSRQNVEAILPNQVGVYGIARQGLWVYIGKGDIRERLLKHLNGDNPKILAYRPTHWVDEVWATDPSLREKQLIVEHNPVVNRQVG